MANIVECMQCTYVETKNTVTNASKSFWHVGKCILCKYPDILPAKNIVCGIFLIIPTTIYSIKRYTNNYNNLNAFNFIFYIYYHPSIEKNI